MIDPMNYYWLLKEFFISAGFMGLSIFFHEYGHFVILHIFYPSAERPRFFGTPKRFFAGVSIPDGVLTNEQLLQVFWFGIIVGMVPLLLLLLLVSEWMFALCLGMYFLGCKSDVEKLLYFKKYGGAL